MDKELYDIYYELNDSIYSIIKEENSKQSNEKQKLVYPLFIQPTDEYNNANIKLMIFGQETNGWGNGIYGEDNDKDVGLILDDYEGFFCDRWCYKYGGQFWNTIKRFINELQENNKDKKIAYLWNNLIKIGKNRKGFIGGYLYNNIVKPYFNKLIITEISILQPDFIIFFTGPNYDYILDDIFGNPKRIQISGFIEKELCEIEIKNIKKAFRTYHPTFLLRNNKKRPYKEYLAKIIEEIEKEI